MSNKNFATLATAANISDDTPAKPSVSKDLLLSLEGEDQQAMSLEELEQYQAIIDAYEGREEAFYDDYYQPGGWLDYQADKDPQHNYYHWVKNGLLVEKSMTTGDFWPLFDELQQKVKSVMNDWWQDFDKNEVWQAIFKAHRVSIYNKPKAQRIKEKLSMLKAVGLSDEAIRYLLDNWYCIRITIKRKGTAPKNIDRVPIAKRIIPNTIGYPYTSKYHEYKQGKLTTLIFGDKLTPFVDAVARFITAIPEQANAEDIMTIYDYINNYGVYKKASLKQSRRGIATIETFIIYNIRVGSANLVKECLDTLVWVNSEQIKVDDQAVVNVVWKINQAWKK